MQRGSLYCAQHKSCTYVGKEIERPTNVLGVLFTRAVQEFGNQRTHAGAAMTTVGAIATTQASTRSVCIPQGDTYSLRCAKYVLQGRRNKWNGRDLDADSNFGSKGGQQSLYSLKPGR